MKNKQGKVTNIGTYGFQLDKEEEWYNIDNPHKYVEISQEVSIKYDSTEVSRKDGSKVFKNIIYDISVLNDPIEDRNRKEYAWQIASNVYKLEKYVTDEELHNLKKVKDFIEEDLKNGN